MRQRGIWLKAPLLMLAAQATAACAQRAIDLPGERFFPESVTSDGAGHAYVPSGSGGIYKVTLASGTLEPWLAPGAHGSASIFGVLVDPVNGLLWACSNDLSGVGVSIAGSHKGSVVMGLDPRTAQPKVRLALPGEGTLCNDMSVAPDGTVYVTDSNRSHILRWTPGAQALEDWYHDPRLADPANNGSGLDGIVFAPDGHLYVNNFRTHVLARIAIAPDGRPGETTLLKTSRPLETPDGMRLVEGRGLTLAVAEGGGKISLVTIEGDEAQVRTISQGFSSAAGVTIENGVAWHVAGEMSYIFNPRKRGQTPPLPFRLTPVRLP